MDKVHGLELGADYVTNPFSHLELLARIRAVLRRYEGPYPCRRRGFRDQGSLRVDYSSRQDTLRGQPARLTPTEYLFLFDLTRHGQQRAVREYAAGDVGDREYAKELEDLKVYVRRLVSERGLGNKFLVAEATIYPFLTLLSSFLGPPCPMMMLELSLDAGLGAKWWTTNGLGAPLATSRSGAAY